MLRRNEAWGWFWFLLVLLALITTLCVAGGIQSQGRDPSNHTGPMPANVRQIDEAEFLVPTDLTHLNLTWLCGGGVDNLKSAGGNMMDVECGTMGVTWNSHAPREGSYSGALASMFTSFAYWVSFDVLALILFLIFPRRFVMRDIRDWRWRRNQRTRIRSSLVERREALNQAWVEDRIDTDTYERRMAEIVREEDNL